MYGQTSCTGYFIYKRMKGKKTEENKCEDYYWDEKKQQQRIQDQKKTTK